MLYPTKISKVITKTLINILEKHNIKYIYLYTMFKSVRRVRPSDKRYELYMIVPKKKLISFSLINSTARYKKSCLEHSYTNCLIVLNQTNRLKNPNSGPYSFYIKQEHYKTIDEIFYFKEDYERERI